DLESHLGPANLLESMAPWPGGRLLLKERFDALHTILFGPLDKCQKLASVLGAQVVVRKVSVGPVLGVVHIPDELLGPASSQAASDFLVPKDDSIRVRNDPKEDLGEFKLGTGMIFTYNRRLELTRLGWLSPPSEQQDYFHLIRPRYCEMLGWEPGDMVVMAWNREAIKRVDEEIDMAFEELAHIA